MTPEQVAALAACWRCAPDQRSAILFLLASIAGMTIEQVIAGSSCWKCVPDFPSAELFLLNTIATNGTGGGGGGVATNGFTCGVGAPVSVPASGCAGYTDTATDAFYLYRSGAWILKA